MDVLGLVLVSGLPVKCVKAEICCRMAVLRHMDAVVFVLEHVLPEWRILTMTDRKQAICYLPSACLMHDFADRYAGHGSDVSVPSRLMHSMWSEQYLSAAIMFCCES